MQEQLQNIYAKTLVSVCNGYEPFILAKAAQSANRILFIANDGKTMRKTASLLRFLAPDLKVLEFPAWDSVPYDRVSPSADIVAERINTLSHLVHMLEHEKIAVVSSIGAVVQKLAPKEVFAKSEKKIALKDNLDFSSFLQYLSVNGYNRVEQVMETGEYALRGDIIDIFPSGTENPLRIDLFDDQVERIRFFDVLTQRSVGDLQEYKFMAANEVVLNQNSIKRFRQKYRENFGADGLKDEIYEAVSSAIKYMGMENWLPLFYDEPLPSLLDYAENFTIFCSYDYTEALSGKSESIQDYYAARLEVLQIKNTAKQEDVYRPLPPHMLYFSSNEIKQMLAKSQANFISFLSSVENADILDMKTVPGRDFSHNRHISQASVYAELKDYLTQNRLLNRIICCYSEGSAQRMIGILQEYGIQDIRLCASWNDVQKNYALRKQISVIVGELEHGFKDNQYCLISEQDIWGERQHRKAKKITAENFIEDISSLSLGELVVHIEHGIARFMGLENIVAGGAPHDCLKLLFAHDDKLFVPVENISSVSRYGSDDENVQLDVLGGSAWQARKHKVKEKIRDIAEKLLQTAAQRHLKTADSFVAPSGPFEEFCARFAYSETDDQLNAINDVIADLGAGEPMDRLVCGDVGFGKTEVALRAAFTVAMSGAQVALIVPTTLLARQHYLNFLQRMQGFPIKVKMLSRLTSAKEAKQIKQELADGALEIVIGTHALLAKDIKFCNLGLLIIDEEQHFGVVHKEKLKALKADVHVLTLSATPIPRTLQLSLAGVKQLSIIATPPADRLAARTFVMPLDRVIIKEAINREKFRGGQVFFVCPRVSDINGAYEMLHGLVKGIKIAIAHGQMPTKQLEQIMEDFSAQKYDVLISTTIIESGIDMPNVNTMIVYRADMFGLAQLYQLKGRIGRSKVRGYCYFTVPSTKKLNKIAEKRLAILQALDTLGAGFSIASHDMDIRGSGNVLGSEQSGHIKDVGMALYHHLLQEEIARQRSGMQTDLSQNSDWSVQINTGIPLMIPQNYVKDLGVRLGLYRKIGDLKDKESISDMKEELIDRFGNIPPEVDNLLQTIEIKQMCQQINIEKVEAGAKGILITFHNNEFAKADKLLDLVVQSFGRIQIKPNQKLFVLADLSQYAQRIKQVKSIIEKLASL